VSFRPPAKTRRRGGHSKKTSADLHECRFYYKKFKVYVIHNSDPRKRPLCYWTRGNQLPGMGVEICWNFFVIPGGRQYGSALRPTRGRFFDVF
jgi:hypothetical protein